MHETHYSVKPQKIIKTHDLKSNVMQPKTAHQQSYAFVSSSQ